MGLKTTSSHGTTKGDSSTIYTRIRDFVIRNAKKVTLNVRNYKIKSDRTADEYDTIKSEDFSELYDFPLISDNWAATTDYEVGDKRIDSAKVYECNADHTSSAAFATDVAKWDDVSETHFTQTELEAAHVFTTCYDKLQACLIAEGKTVVDE